VTRPGKPAVVRFYFDADVLGLAKVLVQVRADVTYPGDPGGTLHRRIRPACPITSTAVKDDVWIPQVASLGWLIITRDSRIASKRAELAAVRETGARMVALSGPETVGTWAIGSALLSVARNRTPMRRAGGARSFAALHEQPCVPSRSTDDHSSLIVFVGTRLVA
jgi:PIN like domain